MHDLEKSDAAVVAVRSPNKAGPPAAEAAEQRAETKGNAGQQSTHRTQNRARVTQALNRVRQAARQRKKERFTALLHHVNADTLRTAFYALKRRAAAGVDGVTWQDYEGSLELNLEDLHRRVHRGAYRPHPSRRTYIPKADGRQRPLAISALEDKIVQGACVMVLNAIYEEDFVGFCVLQRHSERRVTQGKTGVVKLRERWGRAPRDRLSGAGLKPLQAASVQWPRW